MSDFATGTAVNFLEDKHKAYVKRVSTDTESFEVLKLFFFCIFLDLFRIRTWRYYIKYFYLNIIDF